MAKGAAGRWRTKRHLKRLEPLRKLLEPYGYKIVPGNNHDKIVNAEGKYLDSISCTPSDPYWDKVVVRSLIKRGYLPPGTKLK